MDTSKIIETSKQLYQDIKCIKEARENQMKVNPIPSSYTKILELRENVFLHQLGLRIWTERARKCWNLKYDFNLHSIANCSNNFTIFNSLP